MSKAKKRFIDANALKKAIDHTGVDMLESADYFGFTYKKIMRVIDDAPTADVAPVRHGQWEDRENPQWRAYEIRHCSVCGWSIHKTKLRNADLKWNYCPNCGCRMDEKEGESDGTKN